MNRPACVCHGVPMSRNGYHDSGQQKWICTVWNRAKAAAVYKADPEKKRAKQRAYYDSLDGYRYNRMQLRIRRYKALARMRARHEGGE